MTSKVPATQTTGFGTAATKDTGSGANQVPVHDGSGVLNTGPIDATSVAIPSGTIGTNGVGSKTVSTSDPSGGADGDIWYKV
jgi:hypothetical protein